MSHHDHKHQGNQHHHAPSKKGLHKNWVTWLVVGLMLAAMLIYVFSDDESIQPGGKAGEGLPSDGPPVEAAP